MSTRTKLALFWVISAVLMLAAPAMTRAQEMPCANNPHSNRVPFFPYPNANQPNPCDAVWTVGGSSEAPVWQRPVQMSACWRGTFELLFEPSCMSVPLQARHPENPWSARGFRLNMDQIADPSIGDFLPPSPTIGGSSVCLVPDAAAQAPTGWQGLERPTVDRVVDLVTGMPLVQVEDLSLPVDGATFRLIRTRSQATNLDYALCSTLDRWWDWTGEGWMISENPFLLIDSAVPDVVGDQPRTTYLILDAHHSIPFQLIEATGQYEAPARFRARLTPIGGTWNAALRTFSPSPTSYQVSLYDGELIYTFVAVQEDVPKFMWTDSTGSGLCPTGTCESTLHARPILRQQLGSSYAFDWYPYAIGSNPGIGMPYYGLCTLIQDKYGHKIEIEYCNFKQQSMNDNSTIDCEECSQNCPSKGQIKFIKISSGPDVLWTLYYVYRIAPGSEQLPAPWDIHVLDEADRYGRRVIDSIYVYKGDKSQQIQNSSLNCKLYLSSRGQMRLGSLIVDAVDGGPQEDVTSLAFGLQWQHRVRYHYSFNHLTPNPETGYLIDEIPLLIKTTIESRNANSTAYDNQTIIKNSVYKYASGYAGNITKRNEWLEAVFTSEDVDRALTLAANPPNGPNGSPLFVSADWLTVNHLALWADSNGTPNSLGSSSTQVLAELILSCASVRLNNSGAQVHPAGAESTWEGPNWNDLITPRQADGSQYIKQQSGFIERAYSTRMESPPGEVKLASLSEAGGSSRHYRLFRFAVSPKSGDETLPNSKLLTCQQSAFHAPYAWRSAVTTIADVDESKPPADYTQARWITVIDEFATREDMTNTNQSYQSGVTTYATKKAQTSRRVVEVSASGVILRDRLWQFTNSDSGTVATVSGAGIGEEFIYERVDKLLDLPPMPLPPGPNDPPDPRPFNERTKQDPLGHLRNELVLVEHRSVGWSVAYLADVGLPEYERGSTKGFVRFYEYEPFMYDGDRSFPPLGQSGDANGDGWPDDRVVRIELKAEGVRRGRAFLNRDPITQRLKANNLEGSGPKLYTRQFFRPALPDDINQDGLFEQETQVQFLVPKSSLLSTQPAVGGVAPDASWSATHTLTYRRHVGDAADLPVPTRPIQSKIVVGTPRRQRPGDTPWYFPVEREWHTASGATEWAASGLVLNPLNPQPSTNPNQPEELQSLTFTRYLRDANDRPLHTIMDAKWSQGDATLRQNIDAPELQGIAIGSPPDSWQRIPATGALNYITAFAYNNPGDALSDIFYPNGNRWSSRTVIISKEERVNGDSDNLVWNQASPPTSYNQLDDLPNKKDWFAREYVFNVVEKSGAKLYSRVLGEIKDYKTRDAVGSPVRTRRVYFATNPIQLGGAQPVEFDNPIVIEPHTQPRFVLEAKVEMGIDANGRASKANLIEVAQDGSRVQVGSKEVNDLVDVRREREIDGTITRVTRNKLGQPLRTYAGTIDSAWSTEGGGSNLVLLNRTEYGNDVNDAWLPTITRQYTSQPSWAESNFYGVPPAVDNDGYVTKTQYDWRMRPVRVDVFGETNEGGRDLALPNLPRLSTTLTILDYLDRPIIQATYGKIVSNSQQPDPFDSLPIPLNPLKRTTSVEVDHPRPDAKEYLNSSLVSIPLVSLVETYYGPDGSVNEVRTYDVSSTHTAPRWHSEFTYSGRNGAPVYAQRPESPVTIGEVDGLGRLAKQRSMMFINNTPEKWSYELGRTDFGMDADGNVVDTRRFERVLFNGGSSNILDADSGTSANAVRSRSVAWFSPKKQNTVSAELGTEQLDWFINGTAFYDRDIDNGNANEPKIIFGQNGLGLDDPNENLWNPNTQITPLLTVNNFDIMTGRLTHTRNPDGTFTQFEYDRAGRLAKKIENCAGPAELRRETSYLYYLGRLEEMRARKSLTDPEQVTRVKYVDRDNGNKGAEIVAEVRDGNTKKYVVVSMRNDLVHKLSLPRGQDGTGSLRNDIRLRYTFSGQVAERIDARGVTMRYFYDALGRVVEIVIGRYTDVALSVFQEIHPEVMTPSSGTPIDRVGYVKYNYDAYGRLSEVIARVKRDEAVISHNRYTYDARGNLTGEIQMHGQLITTENQATAPTINYAWQYKATNPIQTAPSDQIGYDRLISMTYPGHGTLARRLVNVGYGADGFINDVLSRVEGISSRLMGQPDAATINIARFQYVGVARRSSVLIGHGAGSISADLHLNNEIGLKGLDRFGRIADMHYKRLQPTPVKTLFRGRYAYDAAGNRKWAEITQVPVGASAQANTRSQLNQYNALNQLVEAQVGQLVVNSSGAASIQNQIRSDTWALDLLGNWTGTQSDPHTGRASTGNLDGGEGNTELGGYINTSGFVPWALPNADPVPDIFDIGHTVNQRNELFGFNTRTAPPPAQVVNTPVRHDRAGNLIFDGTYVYQYDAWNRLIQINRGRFVTNPTNPNNNLPPPDDDNEPTPFYNIIIDELVKHYTYDGMGRLIRTQSPFPAPSSNNNPPPPLRTERFYYDGVRRIQELVIDPVASLIIAEGSPEPEVAAAANQAQQSQGAAAGGELDETATPLTVEQVQVGNPVPQQPQPTIVLAREYIWGPGDGAAGVDELFVQFDAQRKPWWVLQDAGGDIVALCENASGIESPATVAAQWTYDAYGSVLSADHLAAHPFMHAGHKGLFFDRLDVGVADTGVPGTPPPGAGGPMGLIRETPRLVPFANIIVYNRNRAYNPQFGRFMQQDPNASALALIEAASYNGRGIPALVPAFDMLIRYGDGANLYQYVSSNSWMRFDPMGLFGFDAAMRYMGVGFTVGSLAHDLVSVYAANQESDAEWASDWEMNDDFHTRSDASWIKDLYSQYDINGYVDDAIDFNPLPFNINDDHVQAGFRGNYRTGSRVLRAMRFGSGVVTKGASHHWLFRTLTKWKKGTKEVVSQLPTKPHREMHSYIDRRVRELMRDAPSIYDPRGVLVWKPFASKKGNIDKYIKHLRRATIEYLKDKVEDIEELKTILDEAGVR